VPKNQVAPAAAPETTAAQPSEQSPPPKPSPMPEPVASNPSSQPHPAEPEPGDARTSPSPDVVHHVIPQPTSGARRSIQGKVAVSVRVQVDPRGNVVGANYESEGPSKYFARIAMEAAQRWTFKPSPDNSTREWILLFHFRKDETKVVPTRVGR